MKTVNHNGNAAANGQRKGVTLQHCL